MSIWEKLRATNPKAQCPLSSPLEAYALEIKRTSGGKTEYRWSLDTLGGVQPITQDELQSLLDSPRLPDVLYRYTRKMYEATIVFLKQLDAQYGISIMSDPEMIQCLEQVKLSLPANDQSHFNVDGGEGNGDATNTPMTFEQLCEAFDDLANAGVDDRSEEGQAFRGQLRDFIELNGLDIRINRKDTNEDVLNNIEDALNSEQKPAAPVAPAAPVEVAPEVDDTDNGVERNDDTNEPAARRRARRTL
jgi:hypothetical protein